MNLNPTDIRIGNLIASSGNVSDIETWVIGKVVTILNVNTKFEQVEVETEEEFTWFFKDLYFGIPLTKEWLLKSNFIQYNHNMDFRYKENPKIRICLCRDNIFRLITHLFDDLLDEPKVEYVHDLQNLYYSLTKQELNFCY